MSLVVPLPYRSKRSASGSARERWVISSTETVRAPSTVTPMMAALSLLGRAIFFELKCDVVTAANHPVHSRGQPIEIALIVQPCPSILYAPLRGALELPPLSRRVPQYRHPRPHRYSSATLPALLPSRRARLRNDDPVAPRQQWHIDE